MPSTTVTDAFARDRVDTRRRGSGRNENARFVPEQPGHVRDRAPVVPVGRGDERELTERRERGAQIVEVAPLGLVAEPADEQPVDRPRRAENLEGGQPEPVRLVLHGHRGQSELAGERGRVDHRGRRITGEAPVELRGQHLGARCGRVVPAAGIDEELRDC